MFMVPFDLPQLWTYTHSAMLPTGSHRAHREAVQRATLACKPARMTSRP
jgi:hypothetical protein